MYSLVRYWSWLKYQLESHKVKSLKSSSEKGGLRLIPPFGFYLCPCFRICVTWVILRAIYEAFLWPLSLFLMSHQIPLPLVLMCHCLALISSSLVCCSFYQVLWPTVVYIRFLWCGSILLQSEWTCFIVLGSFYCLFSSSLPSWELSLVMFGLPCASVFHNHLHHRLNHYLRHHLWEFLD